jgi:hypothetical protein
MELNDKKTPMKLILIALALLTFSSATLAQTTLDPNTQRLLQQAARNGNPIHTEITVNSSVHVEAVLIPRLDAKRVFGKEISENYAVMQVIVGNKSKTAALVIHGIFIDYSRWPLSGASPFDLRVAGSPNKYQAPSVPSQVSSEEYRVVRGQLLDAQADTVRNRFLRWLTLAGNLAGSFTFSLSEDGIIKGIAAITGVGIPGVATAWPDRTVEQLNRVSDLGFRTNKLVPKESAEVIVCFFPVDRFLTPGFRKLFLKSPALFFAPLQMLVDKSIRNDVQAALDGLGGAFKLTELAGKLPCYMVVRHEPDSPAFETCLSEFGLERDSKAGPDKVKVQSGGADKFKRFMALEFIGNVSLNRVTVTVDGAMTVDVDSIAGNVSEVDINNVAECGDAGNECLWTNVDAAGGVRNGVVRGSYLKGAQLKIAEADALSITDLKKIDEESTENELRFSFKLNAPIPNQTKLHFTITKPTSDGKQIDSNTWEYVVAYFPSATAISSVLVDDVAKPTKVTVKGKGFKKATPLSVTLIPQTGDSVTVAPPATVTDTTFDIVLPTLHPGCWDVQVKVGELSSNESERFAIPPDPALDSAERNERFIFVKGKDLIDFGGCGKQLLTFKLVKSDGTDPTDLQVKDWNNGAPVLKLPDKAKEGEWKVQVFMGDTMKSEKPLTVRP